MYNSKWIEFNRKNIDLMSDEQYEDLDRMLSTLVEYMCIDSEDVSNLEEDMYIEAWEDTGFSDLLSDIIDSISVDEQLKLDIDQYVDELPKKELVEVMKHLFKLYEIKNNNTKIEF